MGYEVDLDHAIAAVLGVTAQVHTAEFDSIIASIGSRYDVGISAFTITNERMATMDMISISNVGSRFYVAAGNPEGVDPSDHLIYMEEVLMIQLRVLSLLGITLVTITVDMEGHI